MRTCFIFAFVAASFMLFSDGLIAQEKKGKTQTAGEKKGVDSETLNKVRELRRLEYTERHMQNGDAEEKANLRKRIEKLEGQLEEKDVKWRKMTNEEKCNLDPEVCEQVNKMEQVRNQIRKRKEKGEGIEEGIKERERIMKNLRKMHVEDEDLPEQLRQRSMLGDSGESVEKEGKKIREQKVEQTHEKTRAQNKQQADESLGNPPEVNKKSQEAARKATAGEKRTRTGEDEGKGETARNREENRNKTQEAEKRQKKAKKAAEQAKRKAQDASRVRRGGRR